MKLRSISLTNVRRFAGQTATVSGIGDGVSVVAEANEFGKSTFFDALHALFFARYGAASRDVRALQPPSGGAVGVAVEIELPEGRFRIEKSYLAARGAAVHDLARDRLVARDDEAEAWISALIDTGLEGPAGLLWVRQGVTGLDPDGPRGEREKLLGARRDLLSSVAGEIEMMTGGRRMDRVLESCKADLGQLATASGRPRAGGAWKAAMDLAEDLGRRQQDLAAKVRDLSEALSERRSREAQVARLRDPEAMRARAAALTAAQHAFQLAEDHAGELRQAEQTFQIRTFEHERAEQALAAIVARETDLERATVAMAEADARHDAALEAVEVRRTAARRLVDERDAAQRAVERLRTELARAEAHARADAARRAVALLEKRLAAAETQRAHLETATAQLQSNPATAERRARVDECAAALRHLEGQRDSRGVTVTWQGAGDPMLGGAPMPQGVPLAVARPTAVDLPGGGRLTIDPGITGDDAGARQLQQAGAALAKALAACGAATVEAARAMAETRAAAAEAQRLAQGLLSGHAPEGLDALRRELAAARAEADAAFADEGPVGDVAALRDALQSALADLADIEPRAVEAEARAADARDALAAAGSALQFARDAHLAASAAAGDAQARARQKADAARAIAVTAQALEDARAESARLVRDAPDMATARAGLSRAQSASDEAARSTALHEARIQELGGIIRARAEDGAEAALAETEGQLEDAEARVARYEREVRALQLLRQTLEDTRTAARDAYFEPVQTELAPLIAILHQDAALSFDSDSMLPDSLVRGGEAERMETLSGGTAEQIAVLTRLAFARLLARQGRAVPVILDDALVYSDDTRIVRMFTALHRVAADQQILVFTCRQMAFAELGGTRPLITIAQA
ncbi:MAG: chromosome segregation protein SMC [Rhodobacteraceae bacterium]|nr:chromosome segregation protein SMC [Paracoccaceae bacterium]